MHLQLFLFLWLPMSAFAQSTASKQVSVFEFESHGISKKIWVWLPADYDSEIKNYPVLYMHDSQNLFDATTSFAGEWNVDETLERLNAQAIVVGIEHGNEKRIDELTPFAHEKYKGGKADAYLDYMANGLKPEIDKRYRTMPGAKNTAIIGSSLGGLVSFYAVLKYPEAFGKAGVFSPSFWFSEEIYAFAENQKTLKGKKFYFLCGGKEDDTMVANMNRMANIARRKKASIEQKVVPEGEHNEKLWRDNFADAYIWLFGK